MADATETKSNGGETVIEQAKQDIQKEIKEAKAAGKEKELADKLKQELKDAETGAKDVVSDIKKLGANQHVVEGRQVLRTLTRVAAAAAEGIVITDKPQAQKLLSSLAEKGLSTTTAASIQSQLGDYFLGNKDIVLSSANEQKSQFEKDIEALRQVDSNAADRISQVLVDKASDFGKTSGEMRAKFESSQETPERDDRDDRDEEDPFKNVSADKIHQTLYDKGGGRNEYAAEFESYFSSRFTAEKDKNLIASLYEPHAFVKYVEEKKKELVKELLEKKNLADTEENKNKINKEATEELSKNIRADIAGLLDTIFIQLRRERATKPFEEIAREDIYHGISVTLQTLNRRIDSLSLSLKDLEDQKKIPPIRLYRESEADPVAEEVEIEAGGQKIKKTRIRIKPLATPKEVSLSDFVKDSLRLVVSEATHLRQYLHDGRTIYYHPADPERGFYSGLGRYAEEVQGVDVDALFNLPDGDIIQNAYQLYSKALFEQFAKQDWRHEPDQFINQLGSRYSLMEREVMDKLQRMYDIPRERIENAVHMGVGMSRAIFLNEPEMAAFADPVLNEKGGGTGTSYYTNDTSALSPLNPLHWFMRWQGEQQIYPFLFAPVDALQGGGTGGGMWDHKKALELGNKYYESYLTGKGSQGRRLFIDELCNMARAGGPIQRKGWRQFFANEGNFIFEPNSTNLDTLKTWKALENIGYEVMYDLVSSYGGRFPDPLMRASSAKDSTGKSWAEKRTEFFQYLYEKYFDTSKGTLGDYLSQIRNGGASETALTRIRKGEASPNTVEEEIEREVSDTFMYRVLSRMVAQRIPTRLVQDDRDRFSEKGISRYKELRNELGMDIETFDKVMKNIGLAEGILRKEASKYIRDLIAKTGATDLKDIDMSKIGYRLDEAKLRDFLTKAKIDPTDIEQAVKVFNKLQEKFSGNEGFLDKYAQKIKDNSYIGGISVGSANESPFSLAIDELDLSLMSFRGTGPRIIPRAIGDIGIMERALWMNGLRKLKDNLVDVATNGKKDFSPLIQMLQQIKEAHGEVQGHNAQSYETIHKLATAIISYFKKDTMSKGILGLLPWKLGKPGSMAAEMAGGRSGAVWEWDAVDIDNFIVELESKRLLPRDRYDPSSPIKYDAVWVNNPLTGRPFKLPEKLPFTIFGKEIHLFRKRHNDYPIAFSERLRKEHGGKWYNIAFEFAVRYGPLFMAFILYKFLKDSIEEAQGTKKK